MPPVPGHDVADHRRGRDIEEAGAKAAYGQAGQVPGQAGQEREQQHAGGGRAAAGDDDGPPAEHVRCPAAGQQHRPVQHGEGQEAQPGPQRRPVQDVMDEQRNQRAAGPHRGEPVRQRRPGRGPERPVAQRAGQRGERPARPRPGHPQVRGGRPGPRGDRGRNQQQPAVDQERSAQRPGRDQAAHRRAADPAEDEPAAVQAAGPAPLLRRHAHQQQGLRAHGEHGRAKAADSAQHEQLQEGL